MRYFTHGERTKLNITDTFTSDSLLICLGRVFTKERYEKLNLKKKKKKSCNSLTPWHSCL